MKSLVVLCSSLLFAAVPATPALADSFNFSFSGSSGSNIVAASGVFDANPLGNGEFLVTAVSGTATVGSGSQPIAGLLPVNDFFGNDNLFFFNSPLSATFFDFNGLAFALGNGSGINMYFSNAQVSYDSINKLKLDTVAPITITPVSTSPVPEPQSLALLGTGALGAFGLLRRRLAL